MSRVDAPIRRRAGLGGAGCGMSRLAWCMLAATRIKGRRALVQRAALTFAAAPQGRPPAHAPPHRSGSCTAAPQGQARTAPCRRSWACSCGGRRGRRAGRQAKSSSVRGRAGLQQARGIACASPAVAPGPPEQPGHLRQHLPVVAQPRRLGQVLAANLAPLAAILLASASSALSAATACRMSSSWCW